MVEFRRECIPTAELNKARGWPVNPRPGYVLMIKLWNRNIEWFGLKVTFKHHLIQPPCNEQGHLSCRERNPNSPVGMVTAAQDLGHSLGEQDKAAPWREQDPPFVPLPHPSELWAQNQLLCASLGTLCLFPPCPRVLYDHDLGQVWDTPLCILGLQSCEMPPWQQHLFSWDINWNSVPYSWSLPELCHCSALLAHALCWTQPNSSFVSLPWISFIFSLEVPDPWAGPDFCLWTCSSSGSVGLSPWWWGCCPSSNSLVCPLWKSSLGLQLPATQNKNSLRDA